MLVIVAALLLPVLDSDGSLHLLDYARDLKLGLSLGLWTAWGLHEPSHHRGALGCMSVLEYLWVAGLAPCKSVCVSPRGHGVRLISVWLHCRWRGPLNMNLFCFTLVRSILFSSRPVHFRLVFQQHSFCRLQPQKQRRRTALLWETGDTCVVDKDLRELSGEWHKATNNCPSFWHSFVPLLSFSELHGLVTAVNLTSYWIMV